MGDVTKPDRYDWICALWMAGLILLLPFSRSAEIPFSLTALSLLFLLRKKRHLELRPGTIKTVLWVWLCIWLPMLVSSLDSFDLAKSLRQSFSAVRFPMAVIAMAIWLKTPLRQQLVLKIVAFTILFWLFDALLQMGIGKDIFGQPLHNERLNGIFGERFYFFGPTLAILSPFLLEYSHQKLNKWLNWAVIALVGLVIILSGMRAAWLMLLLIWPFYLWLAIRKHRIHPWRGGALAALTIVFCTLVSYQISPLVQSRVSQSLAVLDGSKDAIEFASTKRLSILNTSLRMIQNHPINGVGVRAYPVAYLSYAAADDVHVKPGSTEHDAKHAHNFYLETLTDTGILGLIGLGLGMVIFLRWYQQHLRRNPLAIAPLWSMALMWFPLNSYFSWYGSFCSGLFWWLVGLAAASAQLDPAREASESR